MNISECSIRDSWHWCVMTWLPLSRANIELTTRIRFTSDIHSMRQSMHVHNVWRRAWLHYLNTFQWKDFTSLKCLNALRISPIVSAVVIYSCKEKSYRLIFFSFFFLNFGFESNELLSLERKVHFSTQDNRIRMMKI